MLVLRTAMLRLKYTIIWISIIYDGQLIIPGRLIKQSLLNYISQIITQLRSIYWEVIGLESLIASTYHHHYVQAPPTTKQLTQLKKWLLYLQDAPLRYKSYEETGINFKINYFFKDLFYFIVSGYKRIYIITISCSFFFC